MQWDLSPFRPWEAELVDAEDWTAAVAVQNAYRAGVKEADEEAREQKR